MSDDTEALLGILLLTIFGAFALFALKACAQ